MNYLERDNAQIHYRLDGPEQAPLMMFSNSLGTDLSVWDPILPYLPGYRFLRYDKRGHGKSRFSAPFGMQELVDDAAALLDHVAAREVVFVGLSIGGLIGQGLAAERPDLLRAFVLMDSAAKIGNEDFWAARIATIRENGIEEFAKNLMPRWFTADFIAAGQAQSWQEMVTNCDPEGYIGCCNAIAQTDLWESTSLLSLPVLAIGGAEDMSTPPDLVRETAMLVKGAAFGLIQQAGHLPCVEQPEATAAMINEFVRKLP